MAKQQLKGGFRVTAWPGRLPHPPSAKPTKGSRYEFDPALGALARVGTRSRLPSRPAPITDADVLRTPGETYLKLRALDFSDHSAVEGFVNAYGLSGARHNDFQTFDGLRHAVLRDRVEEARTAAQVAHLSELSEGESLVELQLAADWIADLTNLWIVSKDPKMISKQTVLRRRLERLRDRSDENRVRAIVEEVAASDDAWLDWRMLDADHFERQPFTAARTLEDALAPALQPFHPRLSVTAIDDDAASAVMSWLGVPLVNVLALELFNHIVEVAEYKRCKNVRCRRLFVRQEGRAEVGQHRTRGVAYCSDRCKSQQVMRTKRAKAKQASTNDS